MSIDFSFLDTFEQKRILIVDDDRFIRGVLDKLLRMIGFESITHAEDGDLALEIIPLPRLLASSTGSCLEPPLISELRRSPGIQALGISNIKI